MTKTKIGAVLGIILFGSATNAASTEVHIGDAGYLQRPDGGSVAILKSQDAMSKVSDLSKAGADPALIMEYIACFVPSETKVLNITGEITGAFMSGAGGTSDVEVVTGPQAGCKGTVKKDYLKK